MEYKTFIITRLLVLPNVEVSLSYVYITYTQRYIKIVILCTYLRNITYSRKKEIYLTANSGCMIQLVSPKCLPTKRCKNILESYMEMN